MNTEKAYSYWIRLHSWKCRVILKKMSIHAILSLQVMEHVEKNLSEQILQTLKRGLLISALLLEMGRYRCDSSVPGLAKMSSSPNIAV